MILKAYAKINLTLDVVGKRDDGYHLLKMIMQNIDLYDLIEINKKSSGIEIDCNIKKIPLDERNIAYKAAKIFIDKYDIKSGVKISIHKNIPIAAGLAGGSTDAAAVLNGMNKIFKVNADVKEIMGIGLQVGADVPYCIIGGTALCSGIGENVKKLKHLRNVIVVLVKPRFGVSTKSVYARFDVNKVYNHPDTYGMIQAIQKNNINHIGIEMRNVLENITLGMHPVLKDIKSEFMDMGASGSLMSGSGPSVYGIFKDMLTAQRCYDKFKQKYKDVFITRTI